MMLGLNSVTRVALLLMWASCVVTAQGQPEGIGLSCTDDTDCRGRLVCCDGVCIPFCEGPGPDRCCPEIQPDQPSPCTQSCIDNGICEGVLVCCYNGCGHVCTKPRSNCH
ncbi:uncharacterized protein LOC143018269 [Oratosquilla oratoria]|uniref:uncharacterized protein LOC143018269 n=1 Tax=Oratosquilla oratoria TaxID=337810 RepID=UPI003F75A3FA